MILLTTTFADLFKKSVINNWGQSTDPVGFVLTLIAALVLGLGIYFVYKNCYIGVVYDHSFNVSLVVMTILVSVIIVTISSNIALSLGMVGALSIVRYRTAVKNPMDLMFMFWSITSGIAVGANYFFIAFVAYVFVGITFMVLKNMKGDTTTYMLILNISTNAKTEENINQSLNEYKPKLRSKIVRGDKTELSYEVRIKKDSGNVTEKVSGMEGVNDVTLVQYRGSYEA